VARLRAGLSPKDITPHTLRHTCATLLLQQGTHPTLVQHLLGHATVGMTLDRYSHWVPSMGAATATAMDSALGL
jgi:integrase